MTHRTLAVFALACAALLAFAAPVSAQSQLDPIDTLEKAQDTYEKLTDALSNYESAREALDVLAEMDAARIVWQLNPEDVSAGVDWANKTAKGFDQIQNLIPPGLPGPVEQMIGGYLSAVPVYVKALTGQLQQEIARIDQAAAAANSSVDYDSSHGCDHGQITKTGVRIIKKLDVEDYEKHEIFKRACSVGLRRALAEHDLL